jgi:hypothetical protein
MDQNLKKIYIEDSTFSHCEFSNNPLPPIQKSKDVTWDRSRKYTEEDEVIYTDEKVLQSRKNNEKDIAWLIEPRKLKPILYDYIEKNHKLFKSIFTHDKNLLSLKNSKLIPYGGCWIDKEDCKIFTKTKNVSIISSGKRQLDGHRLRHEVIKKYKKNIDVYGKGYKEIRKKITGLKEYRFQIVIENCKTDYWFTEKLIDCLITGTVPIYYGCPSIGKFFNEKGFVVISNTEDLGDVFPKLTKDLYDSKKSYVKENFELAKKYFLAEKYIAEQFK